MKRLTSAQVEELYLRPAAERAKAARGGGGASGDSGPRWDWSQGVPAKADFVASMSAQFGGSPDRWAADWDRMKAAEGEARGQK